MKVEIKYNQFDVKLSQEELENMALSMKQTLEENNHIIPIEICLETVSKQFGFTYKEIIDKFENIEYQINKYHLQYEWVKNFMALNFTGWKIVEEDSKSDDCPDFVKYEIFGEPRGVQFDLDAVYGIIWKNLLELIYLELSVNPIEVIKFNDKVQLEKYLLQNTTPNNPVVNSLLHIIHKNMEALGREAKIELLNNIEYDYLPGLKDNKILYNMNN